MANDSLTRAHIIGDVLDPFTSSVPLTVMYDGRPVFDGMEFRASAVSVKPRVEIGGDDFRVAYTLVSHHSADPSPFGRGLHQMMLRSHIPNSCQSLKSMAWLIVKAKTVSWCMPSSVD
jgi:protein FLOWERING LOCUS T